MSPKHAEFIIGDRNAAAMENDRGCGYSDREALERHFYYSTAFDVPLANRDGAIYMQQLVHYIAGTLLPTSGEWINIDTAGITNTELLKQIKGVQQYLAGTISQTNFYKQITEVIYNALLYNRAIIEPQYSAGLSFLVHDHADMDISDLTDDYSNRAYTELERTVDELKQIYTNVPEHLAANAEDATSTKIRTLKCVVPNREPFVPKGAHNAKQKFVSLEIVLGDEPVVLKPRVPRDGYSVISCNNVSTAWESNPWLSWLCLRLSWLISLLRQWTSVQT